jgi:SAM-dependent methyltransferase
MKPQFAEKYANLEQWHWWFRGRQRILETVLRRQQNGRQALSIAALGCGPTFGLSWLKSFATPEGRVIGLDLDQRHGRNVPHGIYFVVGKLEEVPLREFTFDFVMALDVLEHLDDDMTGLLNAFRLVKPNGMLLVTVPALPSLWGQQDEVSHHKRRYTKRTLQITFEKAGLPRPSISYFNTLLFPPIAAIRWSRRVLGTSNPGRSDFEDTRPGLTNTVLANLFAVERYFIQRIPFPFGVTLLATLRC